MMEWMTPGVTFLVYAGVCAGGWWAVWRIYPETMGLSLEEVGRVLEGGWGVGGRGREGDDEDEGGG